MSSTTILSNEEFKISLNKDVALLSSPIIFSPIFAFLSTFIPSSQDFVSTLRSLSNSETDFFSATVLTITPKFFGLIDLIRLMSLNLSSRLDIFLETLIASEKETKIKCLPAIESSVVTLGPFVEIGSFTI